MNKYKFLENAKNKFFSMSSKFFGVKIGDLHTSPLRVEAEAGNCGSLLMRIWVIFP